MKSSLTMLKRAVPLACAALCAAGTAQAALQDRDLNGDKVVDAFYDTDRNITWLRDANVNGPMNWDAAAAWAANFSLGGYKDWKLPKGDDCHIDECLTNDLSHLYYVELGNPAMSRSLLNRCG